MCACRIVDVLELYAFVVKSVSVGRSPPSAADSQEQLSAERFPQAHVEPVGMAFSVADLSQVHAPAGRALHEHLAP